MKPELKTAVRVDHELTAALVLVKLASAHARDASKAERKRESKEPEDGLASACKANQRAARDAMLAVRQATAAFEPWMCHGGGEAFLAVVKTARLAVTKAHFAAQGMRFATERAGRKGLDVLRSTDPVYYAAWRCEVEAKRSEDALERAISQLWATGCPTLILP